ncbi:MAG TPA: signal peptidase II [Actinomycetota bacterium]|nr:signal peptidase II [Actinomycetota bacterium]
MAPARLRAGDRLAGWLYAAAAAAYLLDRASKIWAERTLAGRPPLELVPGVLRLTFTTNSGGAFGIGRTAPWLFASATVVVSALIVAASFRVARRGTAVALGLILGGALGNLTDRLVRGPGISGQVVDFIDLRVWPVFNLADSAIVVGAALLVLGGIRREDEARGARRAA